MATIKEAPSCNLLMHLLPVLPLLLLVSLFQNITKCDAALIQASGSSVGSPFELEGAYPSRSRTPHLIRHKREDNNNYTTDGPIVQQLESADGSLLWTCEITLGDQNFTVLIDTGSSDLWLPSVECTSEPCLSARRRRFDPAKSSSLAWSNNRSIEILYGGDAGVQGVEAKDTLKIGGLTIDSQSFLLAKQVTGSMFRGLQLDGILGLAFKFGSQLKALNPFEQMIGRKLIKEAVFSIAPSFTQVKNNYEAPARGRLVFGSAGRSYCAHEFKNASLVNDRHWEFALAGVALREASSGGTGQLDRPDGSLEKRERSQVAPEVCTGHVRAIADSGTPLILGHPAQIRQLNAQLGAQESRSATGSLFRFANCSQKGSLPNLIFKISDTDELVLTPQMYVLERGLVKKDDNGTDNTRLECISGLTVLPDDGYPFWILGNIFLFNFNTLYDYTNKRVGFAGLHSN